MVLVKLHPDDRIHFAGLSSSLPPFLVLLAAVTYILENNNFFLLFKKILTAYFRKNGENFMPKFI